MPLYAAATGDPGSATHSGRPWSDSSRIFTWRGICRGAPPDQQSNVQTRQYNTVQYRITSVAHVT